MEENVPYYHFKILSQEQAEATLNEISGYRRMGRTPIFDEDDEFRSDLSRIAHSIGWEL